MSWSPDLFIGELRPWPDTVHVVRGKTDETRRYVPEEMLFHERDGHDEQFERARSLEAENAKLRELLLDVHALGCSGFDCTECPIAFAERCNDEYSGCEWVSILTDRMRELGIEVDE